MELLRRPHEKAERVRIFLVVSDLLRSRKRGPIMANMSYCRFHNTLVDLEDCYEHMDDDLSEAEIRERERLIDLCRRIVEEN